MDEEMRLQFEPFVSINDWDVEDMSEYEHSELQEMLAVFQNGEKCNNIRLKSTELRNVVLLGRSHSGKSTVVKVLQNPAHIDEGVGFLSGLSKFNFHRLHLDQQESGGYNINIVDPPGLFQRKRCEGAREPSTSEVCSQILDCLRIELSQIHCIFFVCSFEAGINPNDIQAITELSSLFKGAESVFHMLITRCEDKSPSMCQRIEAEVRAIPELEQFFSLWKVSVFFSGALSRADFLMLRTDSIRDKLYNVMHMRAMLYKHIFNCSSYVRVNKIEAFNRRSQMMAPKVDRAPIHQTVSSSGTNATTMDNGGMRQWRESLKRFDVFSDMELAEMASLHSLSQLNAVLELLEGKVSMDRFRPEEYTTRNIVVLGCRYAGQSAFVQMLQTPTQIPTPRFSNVLDSFTMEYGEHIININVVDLFGQATGNGGHIAKTLVDECLEHNVERIHTAFFACQVTGGISSQDVQAMTELSRLFKGTDKALHLLITHSERRSSHTWKIEAEVRAIPELEDYFASPDVKVFFSGTLNNDDFLMLATKTMSDNLKHVMDMRTRLYDHILSSSTPIEVRALVSPASE
eukprot:TRINITY_DN5992_c0_g1_i1.p1 TRINITY_DN5992_c0_g1~~TRINITY_DN5992_c0_g1_i1.p1  ORF type:complete len:574 (-),score=66.69 TRINITY_DN5992_c0_g1_i1:22-1743(-)